MTAGVQFFAESSVRSDLTEQLIELIPRLRRFARGLCGDRDRGDELVQSACERLLKNQARLRPDTCLDSWMFLVIRNLFIDGTREQAVRNRKADEIRHGAELQLVTNNTVEEQIRLREVQEAMRQLSEEHRSALMLICVEGLSYREAAEVLEIPVGTVASRLIRARKALIGVIGEEGTESSMRAST